MPQPEKLITTPSEELERIEQELDLQRVRIQEQLEAQLPSDVLAKVSITYHFEDDMSGSLLALRERNNQGNVAQAIDALLPLPERIPEQWCYGRGYVQHDEESVGQLILAYSEALDALHPEACVGNEVSRKLGPLWNALMGNEDRPDLERDLGEALRECRWDYRILDELAEHNSHLVGVMIRNLRIDEQFREWGSQRVARNQEPRVEIEIPWNGADSEVFEDSEDGFGERNGGLD